MKCLTIEIIFVNFKQSRAIYFFKHGNVSDDSYAAVVLNRAAIFNVLIAYHHDSANRQTQFAQRRQCQQGVVDRPQRRARISGIARADGKREKFEDPVDYFLDYSNGQLTLHFTLPAKTPFNARQLVLEVFDRSFFIDFRMADKDPVKLVGAPEGCKMQLQRPNDGSAHAQALNEQTFADGGANANFGMMFANKITVDCP